MGSLQFQMTIAFWHWVQSKEATTVLCYDKKKTFSNWFINKRWKSNQGWLACWLAWWRKKLFEMNLLTLGIIPSSVWILALNLLTSFCKWVKKFTISCLARASIVDKVQIWNEEFNNNWKEDKKKKPVFSSSLCPSKVALWPDSHLLAVGNIFLHYNSL